MTGRGRGLTPRKQTYTTEELVAEFSATMPGFAEAWARIQAAHRKPWWRRWLAR